MAHTLHAPLIWLTERPSGTVTLPGLGRERDREREREREHQINHRPGRNHGTNLRPATLGGSLSIPCAGRGMGGLFVAHVHNSWGGTEQERRWFAGAAVQQHGSQLFLVDNIFCLDGSAND